MKGLKITLVKSLAGRLKKQIATAESLGLRKINDCTIQPNNAATAGKLNVISHLIKVEEC